MKTVVILGAFDTKGEEYGFLRDQIASEGVKTLLIDTSVIQEPKLKPDIPSSEVAAAAGEDLDKLRAAEDRGPAVTAMAAGASAIVKKLHAEGKLDGIIGLGGSGGTTMVTTAMQGLPTGVPKVMVSTLACGDTTRLIAGRDIVMIYPIVDIAGLNSIFTRVAANAAGAIVGMVNKSDALDSDDGKTLVGASQVGITTACVDVARKVLGEKGIELLPFHATGTGGNSLEALAADKAIDGVLDISPTELTDELLGGIHSAGPTRVEAAGQAGLPQVVSLGGLNVCHFGPFDTVPEQFRDRNLYRHNANVTIMQTNAEENYALGKILCEKLNRATGPVELFVPLHGISFLDMPGKPFHDPDAGSAIFDAIAEHLNTDVVTLHERERHLNDPEFGTEMAERMIALLKA
jgi:uncharacterized protein (UPF0261 family)